MDYEPPTISDMVKRASDNCQKNHKASVEGCYFCRFDRAALDIINGKTDQSRRGPE